MTGPRGTSRGRSVHTKIEITLPQPVLTGHIVDALATIPDHYAIGIATLNDYVRIVAEHEEPQGV